MQSPATKKLSQKEDRKDYAPSIHIRPELTTPALHEAIELYMAEKRLEGVVLKTKPSAVVHILKDKLSIR